MPYPFLHVVSVEHLGGHRLAVSFTDGTEREVDLSGELDGEVFAPLRDESAFAEVYVDAETGTITWPNGADVAPEFLRDIGREVAPAVTR